MYKSFLDNIIFYSLKKSLLWILGKYNVQKYFQIEYYLILNIYKYY